MEKIRQPIISVLGHVDHGKTTVLDAIRGSIVAKGEAGGITQHIGASEIPFLNIKKVCGSLLEKIKMEVDIPGLLFIDTPGHEAFTTLRKRGGSIADIAILVVDINEGLMPQTKESILYLKEFKTPFVIAANKIDRTLGWVPSKGQSFLKTYNEQSPEVQQRLEDNFYELVGQLGTEGFNTERYDRVTDFTKQITIVPISGITGEGIPDLLMVLMGLTQKYLKNKIAFKPGKGKGTVLEVKEHKGLGLTLDVILYNGEAKRGDHLIIGGKEIVATKVKGLLKPEPLKEIRVEKKFASVDYVAAASGIKIIATGIESVIAGSPLIIVSDQKDIESAKEELKKEIQEVEIHTEKEGAIVKTDTIGSLEAMIKVLKDKEIPIKKAEIGTVSKQDVMEVKNQPDPLIFAFNVGINSEADSMAKDSKVVVISSKIIYKLLEDYDKWVADRKKREEDKILDEVVRPAKMRILPGCVFRQSKPAVFGVEISAGIIKPEFVLTNKGKKIGKVSQIQVQGHTVKEAKKGERAAVSMDDVIVGKQVNEGDSLEVFVNQNNISLLEKIRHRLSDDEKQLLDDLESR